MYRTVKQYSYVMSIGMDVVTLKEIEALFGVDVVPFVVSCLYSLLVSLLVVFLCSLLVRALLFTRSGFFVNPARLSPDEFVEEGGRLKLREPSSTAVCLMTGVITECSVIAESLAGAPDNAKAVHKVCIAPFRQDFRRDTTLWGVVLNFYSMSGAVSAEGIAFTTRPKSAFFPSSSCEWSLVFLCILSYDNLHSRFCTVVSQKGRISNTDRDAQPWPCSSSR
jgi:hypothetical protein